MSIEAPAAPAARPLPVVSAPAVAIPSFGESRPAADRPSDRARRSDEHVRAPPKEAKGEARTSNEVAGFEYSRWKAALYTLGILLKVPFLPFWPVFVAYEAKDWSIARNYPKTMKYLLTVVVRHLRFGSFLRLLKYNLLMGPEQVKAAIAERRGACARCAKCCQQFDCIFLGRDGQTREFYCRIYQTDYWYYGTCGRYPLDQWDIDSHACPGFSFLEN